MQVTRRKASGNRAEYRRPPDSTRAQFARWITTTGGSRAAAEILGISRSYVDMIKNGDRSPGLVTAHRIAQQTAGGIPMEAWLGDAEGAVQRGA